MGTSDPEEGALELFKHVGIDPKLAASLVDNGYTTVEELAYVPIAEIEEVVGRDDDISRSIRRAARTFLLKKAADESIEEN